MANQANTAGRVRPPRIARTVALGPYKRLTRPSRPAYGRVRTVSRTGRRWASPVTNMPCFRAVALVNSGVSRNSKSKSSEYLGSTAVEIAVRVLGPLEVVING